MGAQPPIEWRLHLRSSPEQAFAAWASDAGRELFWAERSSSTGAGFTLTFISGETLEVAVLDCQPSRRLLFRYFGGSTVAVEFSDDGRGGCELRLVETDPESPENEPGWVSVLLAFKAALDFGIDLRNHDPSRSWDRRYADC